MFSCISDVFQDFFVVAEEKLIKCCFLMLSVSFNSVTIKPVLGQITNQQCSDTKPIRVARLLRRKNLMQQLDLNPRFLCHGQLWWPIYHSFLHNVDGNCCELYRTSMGSSTFLQIFRLNEQIQTMDIREKDWNVPFSFVWWWLGSNLSAKTKWGKIYNCSPTSTKAVTLRVWTMELCCLENNQLLFLAYL